MILGLHGKIGAGKDCVCSRIKVLYPDLDVSRIAFGDAMKIGVAQLFDIDLDFIEKYKRDSGVTITLDVAGESYEDSKTFTLRQILQRFGTEACQTVFGEQVWADLTLPWDLEHVDRVVCVSDVRFLSEATRIKNLEGYIIHVVNVDGHRESSGKNHASEDILPAELINHTIVNVNKDDKFRNLDNQIIDIMSKIMGAKV